MSILSKGKLRSMEDCIHAAHEVITCSIYSTCTCTVYIHVNVQNLVQVNLLEDFSPS